MVDGQPLDVGGDGGQAAPRPSRAATADCSYAVAVWPEVSFSSADSEREERASRGEPASSAPPVASSERSGGVSTSNALAISVPRCLNSRWTGRRKRPLRQARIAVAPSHAVQGLMSKKGCGSLFLPKRV